MALLLAMYQKMRLIREKNQTTLDLTKYSSKLDRVQKNIERVQKRYTSLFAQLDQQAKSMEINAKSWLQNQAGLGVNCVNTNNLMGMNGFVYNSVYSLMTAGDPDNGFAGMDPAKVQEMMDEYMANGKFLPALDSDNKPIEGQYKHGWTQEEVSRFMQAMRIGQTQQQQAQMWVQQGTTTVANNTSIWLEAQKAQLEEQQDAELAPLSYQETMWDLEKNNAEMKLKRINSNLEMYEQLASQEAEKSALTFGLR